jgi:LDH2 family malate/lactate/ureidoglycolate dehydrogenase
VLYRPADLLELATTLLTRAGLADDRARDVAEVLLEGDLLGHTTHGLDLLAAYLRELDSGRMTKDGEPVVVSDRGGAITWDGDYLPGPWLIRRAIDTAQQRIANHGVVSLVIRRSHHIGCLQAYLKPVTDAGLIIILTCSDPANTGVTPFGGTAPRITPNPIAAGFPTGINIGGSDGGGDGDGVGSGSDDAGEPVLMDISMSTTTNAMSKRLFASGERMPGPWLVDADGKATDDPAVLFGERPGAILPLGGADLGHKGYALALLVEALTSGLAGFGRVDEPTRWGASVFLQLIDPGAFAGRDAFVRQTSGLADIVHATPVASGAPAVRLPGEGALSRRARQLRDGVTIFPTVLPALEPWAVRYGVAMPTPLAEL